MPWLSGETNLNAPVSHSWNSFKACLSPLCTLDSQRVLSDAQTGLTTFLLLDRLATPLFCVLILHLPPMPSANTHPPLHQTRHISEPEYFTALRNLLPGCDPLEVDAELTERTKEFSVMFIPEAKQCLEEMETELSHLTTTLQAYDTLFPDGLTNRSGKPQPDPDFISHDRHRQKIVLSLQEILSSCLSTLFRDPLLDKLALLSTMLEGRTKVNLFVLT